MSFIMSVSRRLLGDDMVGTKGALWGRGEEAGAAEAKSKAFGGQKKNLQYMACGYLGFVLAALLV